MVIIDNKSDMFWDMIIATSFPEEAFISLGPESIFQLNASFPSQNELYLQFVKKGVSILTFLYFWHFVFQAVMQIFV